GSLPGDQDAAVDSLLTYGAFAFRGVGCYNADAEYIEVPPGDDAAKRCRPDSVRLLFSAAVPRATLAAVRWQPPPQPDAEWARTWQDYPGWRLRAPVNAHDAKRPDDYPLSVKLDPMRRYTLMVPAGVKDQFGRVLSEPVTMDFRTGHRKPFLNAPPAEAVLE